MIMQKFFTFLILLVSTVVFAQKTVSGIIKNSEGEAVPSASITIEEPGKDAIVAYAISNAKGEYKVSFTSSESTLDLKIKAFNHKPQVKSIKNETQNFNISLESEATEIKEVKLKAKMITKRGDTISYDVKAFENKNDRVLADVLKKIPGIEVNKDGTILYQGEAINKFYVNGKDLMEGSYGTINNSLPTDAIQKVEVMENHQPVKILQDKVVSEQAAINIKLKNKVTMTGRAEAGSGFTDPWLWNVKITPMFFGQKNQWVINYKTNNTGEQVENEGNMMGFGNRWEGRRNSVSQDSWLDVENANVPNVPEKRYLMNNVHFLSANLLTNPFKNKEWELKANANYTNNAVERESYNERFDKQKNLSYITDIFNNFYTDKAKAELIFTKNAKKGFFKNTTTFTQFQNTDRAHLLRNSINAAESVESPTSSFQNSLSTIIPWKEKMVNIMSYLSYQEDKQTLDVAPASYLTMLDFGTAELARQNFGLKSIVANHSANISFIKKNWTFTPEVGIDFSQNKLRTSLVGISGNTQNYFDENYRNALDYSVAMPYASMGINYKSDSWLVSADFPANFYTIKAQDAARNLDKNFSKLAFEPSLFAQYSFASFWKASVNGRMGNSFGSLSSLYAGSILSSPSSFGGGMSPDNPMRQGFSKNAGAKVEYRNPLNNLFFNVGYAFGRNKSNVIANTTLNAAGLAVVQYSVQDNYSTSNSEYAEVGKYFPKFKSNISTSFRNTNSEADQYRDSKFFVNKADSRSLSFKFNNTYFSWLSADYNMSFGWSGNENIFGSSKSSNFLHNLSLIFYPVKDHSIGLDWDQLNYSQNGKKYSNAFYDLVYQYTLASKKIDFELKWLNIANHKIFERISDNATYTDYQRSYIRPSQVMFTVKFNFK